MTTPIISFDVNPFDKSERVTLESIKLKPSIEIVGQHWGVNNKIVLESKFLEVPNEDLEKIEMYIFDKLTDENELTLTLLAGEVKNLTNGKYELKYSICGANPKSEDNRAGVTVYDKEKHLFRYVNLHSIVKIENKYKIDEFSNYWLTPDDYETLVIAVKSDINCIGLTLNI